MSDTEEEEEEDEETEDEEEEVKADGKGEKVGKGAEDGKGDEDEEEEEEEEGDEEEECILNIPKDQINILRNAFHAFDHEKKGVLGMDMIGVILELLGHAQSPDQLQAIVNEVDLDGSGELEFDEFCILAAKFLVEEEEDESEASLTKELKEAFRIYDKRGDGFITTADFADLLRELDPDLSAKDIQGIVQEIDVDDSGTIDFEEFMKALR